MPSSSSSCYGLAHCRLFGKQLLCRSRKCCPTNDLHQCAQISQLHVYSSQDFIVFQYLLTGIHQLV
jgi:hypothetical protein